MVDPALASLVREYMVEAARKAGQSVAALIEADPTVDQVEHVINLKLPDGRRLRVSATAEAVDSEGEG